MSLAVLMREDVAVVESGLGVVERRDLLEPLTRAVVTKEARLGALGNCNECGGHAVLQCKARAHVLPRFSPRVVAWLHTVGRFATLQPRDDRAR